MTVITRFAPSPTGILHIGNARTALFNYLLARHHQGKFLLRIEDTDSSRSTEAAIQVIFSSLKWLELDWDGPAIFQSQQRDQHQAVARQLLESGQAYYCFTPQAEIAKMRDQAIGNHQHFIFKSPWRDQDSALQPLNIQPVIRLKAPRTGQTIIADQLQGQVVIENSHLDDMILLRSDGTPTYMLAVVVDDHQMGITHIIRGDDHLTNAARQILIYQACCWPVPIMVHIPLIHSADGAKLSKRQAAPGIDIYKDLGYLPEALNNYLLRLGWSHQNHEIISRRSAVEWFNLQGLGKSPARLNLDKMRHLNAHYLRSLDAAQLTKMVIEQLQPAFEITAETAGYIQQGINSLKLRAQLITELAELAKIYLINYRLDYSDEAQQLLEASPKELLSQITEAVQQLTDFGKIAIQAALSEVAALSNMPAGQLMSIIRALLTGHVHAPSVVEIMTIIGQVHTINRLKQYLDLA